MGKNPEPVFVLYALLLKQLDLVGTMADAFKMVFPNRLY